MPVNAPAGHLSGCLTLGLDTRSPNILLSGLLSRFRRGRQAAEEEGRPSSDARLSNGRTFSARAVGIISNCNESHVELALYRRLKSLGVRRVVYAGPISTLSEPAALWKHIKAGDVDWVYGKAERPRFAPEVGLLTAGPEQLELNGILVRYFVRSADGQELVRFGQLQWPPPGIGREQAVQATASGLEHQIIVIGSGLSYERWCHNTLTGKWELAEQNFEGYGETPAAHVELPPHERHLIIHPTSGGSYCSVIDPEQHLMVFLMS